MSVVHLLIFSVSIILIKKLLCIKQHQRPMTHPKQSVPVWALLAKYLIKAKDVSTIFHGTTVGTNSILEGKGAKVGLITNSGFRDILHIGRHQRPQHYSIGQEIPWQKQSLDRA